MTNETYTDVYVTIEELNKAEVLRQIPLIIYLVILIIFGTFGNVLVLYVYKTKYGPSSCRTFVLFLSMVDLFSASLGIPTEIAFISREFIFQSNGLCKISVFLNNLPTLTSGFVLLAIAVDRYRKICKPFLWQITPKSAKYVCLVCAAVALAFSWISPLIYGVQTSYDSRYELNVSACTVTDTMADTSLPLVNNASFAVLFVGALVGMSVMYIFITIRMKVYAKRREELKSESISIKYRVNINRDLNTDTQTELLRVDAARKPLQDLDTKASESDALFCSETSETRLGDSSEQIIDSGANIQSGDAGQSKSNGRPKSDGGNISSLKENFRNSWISKKLLKVGNHQEPNTLKKSLSAPAANNRVNPEVKNRKRDASRKNAHKTAAIMLRVTIAFVISYVPLLCILLIRTSISGFAQSLNDAERAVYKFFLRSYYLNCAINPVIYGMWDGRFRKTVAKFWIRLKRN